jgi:hypothetical protein
MTVIWAFFLAPFIYGSTGIKYGVLFTMHWPMTQRPRLPLGSVLFLSSSLEVLTGKEYRRFTVEWDTNTPETSKSVSAGACRRCRVANYVSRVQSVSP